MVLLELLELLDRQPIIVLCTLTPAPPSLQHPQQTLLEKIVVERERDWRGQHLLERNRGHSRRERSARGSSLRGSRLRGGSLRGSSLEGGSPDGGSLFDRVVPQVRNSSAGCESTCEPIVTQCVLHFHGVRLLGTFGSDFTMADLKTRSGIDSLLDEQGSGDHTLRMCETNACAPYGLRRAFSFVNTVNIYQYPRRPAQY